MDPEKEQHYQDIIKRWKDNEESVMEKLTEIEEKLDATQNKLHSLMEPGTHSVEDIAVTDFSVRLCALYNNLSQVKVTPWDPDNTVHIDEIYTQLCWFRDDKRPSGTKREKLADYCDIFKAKTNKPSPDRILVYGRPGIGKSTFAQKISIDWARGKKEILKKFDLLLMIPLRNVCGSKTFHDILKEAKLFSAEDQRLTDSLHSYIRQHKDKVLLVLDGFDEYSAGTPSPVFDIWKGDELRECVVILTTRPIKGDEVKRFGKVQFQIRGFDSAQIKEFSMKFLNSQKEVEVFLSYIKKHKLQEIAEIPLLLLMLCLVWKAKDREGLPKSRVYLYSDFIQTLCNHMAAKDGEGTVNSIHDYKAELIQVGELAFNALLTNSLEFDFEQLPNEFSSGRLIRVGVIQIVKLFSAKPKKVVAFLHKSIQEFLAAWFVIHKLIPSSKNSLSCMPAVDSTKKAVAMVEVLKFVSQWSLEGSRAVLQHLESLRKKQIHSEQSSTETLFLEDLSEDEKKLLELNLECFIETPIQSKAEVYPLLLKSTSGVLVIPDTTLHLLVDDHALKSKVLPNYALFNFRRPPSQEQRDHMASIMEDLNVVVKTTSGEREASDFVRKLQKFEVLASLFLKRKEDKLYLHFTQVAGIDVATLNELTLLTPNLSSKSSHNQRHGEETTSKGNFQTREHCFSLAKKIEIEEIENDKLIDTISNVMPLVESPREITLLSSQKSFEPRGIERLVRGMNITECLRRLRLQKVSLDEQSLTVVTRDFHQACNLEEIFLSENPLGSGVTRLAKNLKHLHQLATLELTNVLMEEQAFSDLASSLCHVPALRVLSVSRNNLGLSQTQMDEEGAAALSTGLRSLPKLEVLDISHNPLGSAVTLIADHLQSTPCLTELNMNNTEMGFDGATAVASSFKFLQNLWTLSVGSNPLERGVPVLVQHLRKIPKLKRLDLTSVVMGDEEVNLVSNACKKIQTLTITTDYLDENGERLPARVSSSSFAQSTESNDELDNDYDFDVDRDYEEDDEEEDYDNEDDYDENQIDSVFPGEYDDDDDNDREEDEEDYDIDDDREDYSDDGRDISILDDYAEHNDDEDDDKDYSEYNDDIDEDEDYAVHNDGDDDDYDYAVHNYSDHDECENGTEDEEHYLL